MALPRLWEQVRAATPFLGQGTTKKGRVIYINHKNNWFLVEFEGKGGPYRLAFKGTGEGWDGGRLMPAGERHIGAYKQESFYASEY